MEEERLLKELLISINKDKVKNIIFEYIIKNRLHSEYIELITSLSKNYIDESNIFIERMKRDVNVLYVDKQLGYKVMKDVEINENNWYWYARVLRDTEDEIYPKNNFLQPVYLLNRLKPIIANIDARTIEKDDELLELYKVCLDLYDKYGI